MNGSRISSSAARMITLSIVFLACAGETPPTGPNTVPATITIFSGNSQLANAGAALQSPLQVVVANSEGEELQGVNVVWSVLSGNGTLASTSTTTDNLGIAENSYTVGAPAGQNSIRAIVSGREGLDVTFTVTVVVPPVASVISIVSGDAQTANTSAVLPQPLVVLVGASDGQAVGGEPVTWTVLTGGGTLNTATTTSAGNGQASVTYTLGPAAGGNTVQAQLGEQAITVVFTATATAAPSATVSIGDNFFNPDSVAINTGETVRWNWTGGASHNVTFDVGGQASTTQTSGDYSQAFPNAGTFTYHCTIHGAAVMSGQVMVN